MNNQDFGKLLLRLTLGGLMIMHGIAKMKHGVDGISDMLTAHNYPGFLAYGVYVGEVIAPLMIIFGWRLRLGALIFAFNMAVAVFLAHPDDIGQLGRGGAWAVEIQALYFFGALALVFLGAGRLAVSSSSKWD